MRHSAFTIKISSSSYVRTDARVRRRRTYCRRTNHARVCIIKYYYLARNDAVEIRSRIPVTARIITGLPCRAKCRRGGLTRGPTLCASCRDPRTWPARAANFFFHYEDLSAFRRRDALFAVCAGRAKSGGEIAN